MFEMDARTSTELGVLPLDWQIQRFDSLFDVQQGKQVSKKNREGGNQRPFLRTKNVYWGCIDLIDLDEMNFTETEEKRLALKAGDLLICEGGDIGRTAIWKGGLEPCYHQNHLHRARLRNQDADSGFALYWLWYAFEIGNVYFGRGNVTTIPNLAQSKLRELPMPVPPLDEQRKIAAVLGVVQQAIEHQERLLALTAELKKTLLHQFFTQGLRGEPQKQTEIGLVPESWEVRRLGDYARVLNGYAFKSGDYVKEGVRLIRISNVAIGTLIEKDDKFLPHRFLHEKAEYALKEGDLILSLTRPIIADGMKFCFVQKRDLPALLNQRVGKFEITSDRLLKDYLSHVVFSDYFTKPLRFMAEGSNQPNISPTRLENFLIPIPTDLQEQAEIATVLTNLTKKAELAQRKAHILTDLFRTLLHQLMTAQIRVHDLDFPEIEIAGA